MKKTISLYSISAIAIVAILGATFFPLAYAYAFGLPFGGLVDFVDYYDCDCPLTYGASLLYFSPEPVYPPSISSVPLAYNPYITTQIYANGVIPVAGVYLLGTYLPGEVTACMYYVYPYECYPSYFQGAIDMVGTSL